MKREILSLTENFSIEQLKTIENEYDTFQEDMSKIIYKDGNKRHRWQLIFDYVNRKNNCNFANPKQVLEIIDNGSRVNLNIKCECSSDRNIKIIFTILDYKWDDLESGRGLRFCQHFNLQHKDYTYKDCNMFYVRKAIEHLNPSAVRPQVLQ